MLERKRHIRHSVFCFCLTLYMMAISDQCLADHTFHPESTANSLQSLAQQAEHLPAASELKGDACHLSSNNQLPKPWYIFMPGFFLPSEPAVATLEQAIFSSLSDYPFQQGESVLLDIAHLGENKDSHFFEDYPDILKKLDAILDGYDIKLTIRYLEGNYDPEVISHGDGNHNPVAQQFKRLADRHPHQVQLYFGSLAPGVFGAINGKNVAQERDDIEKQLTYTLSKTNAYTIIPKIDFDQMVKSVLNYLFSSRTISWNHSKIVALNGASVIEGGANYWSDYQKRSTTPFDLDMRVNGPAAVDAHHFCNALWRFLTSHQGLSANYCQHYNTSMEVFEETNNVPSFTGKPAPKGDVQVLAANTLGVWGSAELLQTMVLPTVDMVANMAHSYLKSRGWEKNFPLLSALLYRNAYSAFYTARYLRRQAIAGAKYSIKFSQQKFVMDELMNNTAFKSLVSHVNSVLGMKWDGMIWPYDVIAALADTVKQESFKTVDIVASNYQPDVHPSYGDPLGSGEFTRMLSLFAGQPVDKKVNYRRISHSTKIRNHAKLTIIDGEQTKGQLINIGSENMFPSYNQQFNFWLEDADAIKAFITKCWQPLWQYSVAP